MNYARKLTLFVVLAALAPPSCGDDLPTSCPRGRPVLSARADGPRSVEIKFGCRVDTGDAGDAGRYTAGDYSVIPPRQLTITGASADRDTVTLDTAQQVGLATYTLRIDGVRDAAGEPHSASVNFIGGGSDNVGNVTLRIDDRYNAELTEVRLLLSVDPLTWHYSHTPHTVVLSDPDRDHVFRHSQLVKVDPARTRDTADDRLGSQHMAYSVRAVDAKNRPLSELVLFEVLKPGPKTVDVPLLSVPDPPPPEGLVTVTFRVDDRPARALRKPSLKASIDSTGHFDANFPTTVALADKDGDDIWEGTARVRIAPKRVLSGATTATKPYSAHLVEGTTPHSARSVDFEVTTEKAVTASLLIGAKGKVPVTFRVDVGHAWLDTSGTNKGVYKGESIFLTGEFAVAEDAFGDNATDSFSGGENVVLQMVERSDRPGVWERTIFLPPNRPYGWKVVRCPTDKGCTQLNKKVTSSGRAFPTVMKNLTTELCDASKKSWPDKNCASPRVIDPRDLKKVNTGAGTLDYSSAKIHAGAGGGVKDQEDPAGTPKASLMFKQESPDLLVDVKTAPVQTPVYVIGTWRDVNIAGSPADIVAGGSVLDLTKSDYDAGMVGLLPPAYQLPPPAKPSPFKMDGKVDGSATLVAGGSAGMPLYMALSASHLYVATDDAGEGSDNFILLSATKPGAARPAPWAKAGTVAFGGKTLFLADENDSNYAGWFELASPNDKLLEAQGQNKNANLDLFTPVVNGGALEGAVNLKAFFGGKVPATIYVACAPYTTTNNGAMYDAAQTPPAKAGKGNIDANEILNVSLPSLKVVP